MAFTEADKRRLEALKEKQKQAKQEEQNEKKKVDRWCRKYFGLSFAEVKKLVDGHQKAIVVGGYDGTPKL